MLSLTDLRQRLEAAGLNEDAVAAALGPVPSMEAARAHLELREPDTGRAALIRLFMFGETVPTSALPVDADELTAAGLAERDGDSVRNVLRLSPHEGLLLAHDGDEHSHDADYVTGVNNATQTLASLTIRQQIERALDLGTGCGVHALLATQHAGLVVATDVNQRALSYARLNGRLNGLELDVRRGSFFEPVEDELFDLIVSNPPFVISPDSTYVFRDSGLAGDAVSREVVRGAAAHLREGGLATVLCNWICREPGETWQPLAAWVEGTGCDALLMAHEPVEPFTYATRWNEPLRGDAAAFSAAVARWLASYERDGVAAIGIGAVVLRRRDGANWHRGLDLARPGTGRGGDQLLRLFAAADAPLGDDRTVLGERFRLVDGHRIDQRLRFTKGEYALGTLAAELDDAVGLVAVVDPRALPALFALEPGSPLRDAIDEAGAEPGAVLPTVRRLYELGFLDRA